MEEDLVATVKNTPCDILLITRGSALSLSCIRELSCLVHTHFRYIDANAHCVKSSAALCSTSSASATGTARILNTEYIPDGCDPACHFPGSIKPSFVSDVSMIGKPYSVRMRIITELRRQGFNTKVYGSSSWPHPAHHDKVYHGDFRDVVASSRINLATNLHDNIPGWTSIRVILLLACAGFTMVNRFPEIEKMFDNGRHLVWYDDEEQVVSHVRFWLKHEDQRRKIAQQGRHHVLKRFTVVRTALKILKACGA